MSKIQLGTKPTGLPIIHPFEPMDYLQEFAAQWLGIYNHEYSSINLSGITSKQKLALTT